MVKNIFHSNGQIGGLNNSLTKFHPTYNVLFVGEMIMIIITIERFYWQALINKKNNSKIIM